MNRLDVHATGVPMSAGLIQRIIERAHDLFDAYLPLARYEQQPGIGLAVRKHLLAEIG